MNYWITRDRQDGIDIICPFCGVDLGIPVDIADKFTYCPVCGNRVITFTHTEDSDKEFLKNCTDLLDYAYSDSYEVPLSLAPTLSYARDRISELIKDN